MCEKCSERPRGTGKKGCRTSAWINCDAGQTCGSNDECQCAGGLTWSGGACRPCTYENVGAGFCRTSGCNSLQNSCRVNGFYKDNSDLMSCMNMCDSKTNCVGFAISDPDYSASPNRCYVHGRSMSKPSGWTSYSKSYYHIAGASGTEGVTCYATKGGKNILGLII